MGEGRIMRRDGKLWRGTVEGEDGEKERGRMGRGEDVER